jgi:predicted GIY-YIG superfamily endonuclease
MWYVYILSSQNEGKLYVGSTIDLKRRLEASAVKVRLLGCAYL